VKEINYRTHQKKGKGEELSSLLERKCRRGVTEHINGKVKKGITKISVGM
jgi:hypothetical protein